MTTEMNMIAPRERLTAASSRATPASNSTIPSTALWSTPATDTTGSESGLSRSVRASATAPSTINAIAAMPATAAGMLNVRAIVVRRVATGTGCSTTGCCTTGCCTTGCCTTAGSATTAAGSTSTRSRRT